MRKEKRSKEKQKGKRSTHIEMRGNQSMEDGVGSRYLSRRRTVRSVSNYFGKYLGR